MGRETRGLALRVHIPEAPQQSRDGLRRELGQPTGEFTDGCLWRERFGSMLLGEHRVGFRVTPSHNARFPRRIPLGSNPTRGAFFTGCRTGSHGAA